MHQRRHTWLVTVGGAMSVVFGAYLLVQPIAGVVALATALGVFAIAYGVAMVGAGTMLKRVHDQTEVTITPTTAGVRARDDSLTPR